MDNDEQKYEHDLCDNKSNYNEDYMDVFRKVVQNSLKGGLCDADKLFLDTNYIKISIISETKHSKIYKARPGDKNGCNDRLVAIKKYELQRAHQLIQFEDKVVKVSKFEDYGFKIKNEASMLKYLAGADCSARDFIVKYIDFQEGDGYYLVMEYIESEMNLKQFLDLSFKYIKEERMDSMHYGSIIKLIFWQLSMVMKVLHHDMKC